MIRLVLRKPKACMDQFMEGLDVLQVASFIRSHPALMEPLFVKGCSIPLSPAAIKAQVTVKFADPEAKKRERTLEEAAYIYFVDECAEGDCMCTLEDILVFFTGASSVPPLGFDRCLSIVFLHDPTAILPTASTCALQLRLPTCFVEYASFREHMELALKPIDGFGGV